jgi:hypothetical protein
MADRKKKKKAVNKPAKTKKKAVVKRKRTQVAQKSSGRSKGSKPAKRRAVQKTTKKRVVSKKTPKKRYKGRAPVVRRKNKLGRTFYFNKRTKKFTKKSNWYKYRAYAIKHKPKKAPAVAKEKEKLTIDLESALIKINLDKATESELREEINRLAMEQTRWRDRLNTLKLKKNKNKVRRQLTRYARAINKIKKILGTYEKPRGFEEETYQIGKNVIVDNIYRWEVKKFLDELLKSEQFEIYVVQGESFMAEHQIDIHMAVDDLVIDAEMSDIYYLKFTRNSKTKVVHIILNQ